MTFELTILAWTLVLALVQILLPAAARTREFGLKWNAGARDETPAERSPMTGRLARAQINLFETLPLFAAAVLIAHVAGREDTLTAWGAGLYLFSRVLFLPLYAFGVRYQRSLAWIVGLVGLVLILVRILVPA